MDYKKVAYYIAKYNYVGIPNELKVNSIMKKWGVLSDFKDLLLKLRCIAWGNSFNENSPIVSALEVHCLHKNKTSTQLRLEVNEILKNVLS